MIKKTMCKLLLVNNIVERQHYLNNLLCDTRHVSIYSLVCNN